MISPPSNSGRERPSSVEREQASRDGAGGSADAIHPDRRRPGGGGEMFCPTDEFIKPLQIPNPRRARGAMTSRRKFLTASGLAIGAVGLRAAAQTPVDSKRSISQKAAKPLRLLILGGTGFIGPHEVRYAIERGHRITLFNRGKSQPSLFPEVEKLHGDRATGNYDSLKGREWDVVIDNPTTLPRWVRQAAEVLQKQVKQYIFISTVS